MRVIIATLLVLVTAFITQSQPAHAQQYAGYSQPANDIPLLVIRYNQQRVYYEKQLFNAATKALDIKPSVVFSIVSFVPQFGSSSQQKRLEKASSQQINQLVGKLREMGLPRDRINVSTEKVSDARHHEIYVYVD